MNEAQEILRKHGVEIDASDHRPAEEIVRALGLVAGITEQVTIIAPNNTAEDIKARRPYFAN